MGGPVDPDVRDHLTALVRASRVAADPGLRVGAALADDPTLSDWALPEALRAFGAPRTPGERAGRLALLALGRDAEALARGALAVFGDAVDEGLVAVPSGVGSVPEDGAPFPPGIERVVGRPVDAGRRAAVLVEALGARDRAVILVSPGSASAAARPLGGVTPADIEGLAARLRAAGWSSARVHALRSRLDALQGGGLRASASPAAVLGFRLPGDPPSTDPLGVAPPSGRSLEIELRVGGIPVSERVRAALRSSVDDHPSRRVRLPGSCDVRTLDERPAGLAAAMAEARARGLATTVLTDRMRGGAEDAGRGLGRVAAAIADGLGGLALPACALAAGRTDGSTDRHRRLERAAGPTLDDGRRAAVRSWTPAPGEPDLYAVVVLP